jgi:protein-S-isoprenylcysteine O-methyltransferase Ste14
MEKMKNAFNKIVYGLLFCLFLPLLLILWAKNTDSIISIPIPDFPNLGLVLGILGLMMMVISMANLWFKGKGLPMNAFPPKFYVNKGLYAFFHHPIYIGFWLLTIGISLYFKSSSGFWLISPLLLVLIIAYVQGIENEIISTTFSQQTHLTFFDFPKNNSEKLTIKNRLLVYIWIYLPWLILYELFIFLGKPLDAISTKTRADDLIPFWDFSVVFYISCYFFVAIIPFLFQTNQKAREFIFDSIVGMFIIFYSYLVFPFIIPYQPIENNSIFTELILNGRSLDGETAAFPSFHVFWALIFFKYFKNRFPKLQILGLIICFLIILSCLTTYNHSILDVLSGILVYQIAIHRNRIYQNLLSFSERISNSWKEWDFGYVRFINHGIYAALGGIFGFFIMGYLLPNSISYLYAIGVSGFVGAGLWAQFIEGSPSLLRPYGYYGSIIGVSICILSLSYFGEISIWYLFAVAAMAASAIQFFGRFRCLVQGCCHGKPTENHLGIKFIHPKSRVNKIANWAGLNLYPTQLFSIISNFLSLFFLFRMVSLEMPSSFIVGMYLILNGSFRFVEESLRGEPQTPYFLGMRVYQWLALISIILGAIFTCLDSPKLLPSVLDRNLIIHSLIYGVIVFIAYGVDFPKSNLRFSRLTQ